MSILEVLFGDMATFRDYVPTVEANVTFKELNASGIAAKKQITNIITVAVFDSVTTSGSDEKESLRIALANCTMSRQIVFDVTRNRKTGTDVYKYELEAMRRALVENYYNAMDTLIASLEEKKDSGWKDTTYHKVLNDLPIQTMESFDRLYPIDKSYLFFFRTIPFQQEVADDYVDYISKVAGNDSLKRKLFRAIAKLTVAKALVQFDILEFPVTIRNLFSDNKSFRHGSSEQSRLLAMAQELIAEAGKAIAAVDLVLSSDDATDIVTETSFNEADDKIIMFP
ncbi:MAG: hypothetical protein LBV74_22780 [Tannerella sp.]|jgi:hypothetical protein|nr:hypothetical protein [Tannerella sp.]